MIVKSSESDRIARNPPRGMIAALVFGPDSGLARERSEILLKTVVEDLSDPFRVSELDEQTLANDPARLFDEAASISMLGGRRVVRVRSASNALAKLFESFLAISPKVRHCAACSKRPITRRPFPVTSIPPASLATSCAMP